MKHAAIHVFAAAAFLLAIPMMAVSPAYTEEEADSPHVVFVIAEREFNTRETLRVFAEQHLHAEAVRTTFIEPDDDPNSFPGLIEALEDADLVVLSVRRRALPEDQMEAFVAYLRAGNPLVGIRTASHAFGARDVPEGHVDWPEFDVQVLGGDYQMHYGNRGDADRRTIVYQADEPDAEGHPILRDWDVEQIASDWHLYRNRDLCADSTLLLSGHINGEADETTEPVAWTHSWHDARIFYTSLGGPEDFELEPFQLLLRNAMFWAMDRPLP